MEDTELKNIWQSYDKKIADAQVLNLQSWALNLQCFETLKQQKASAKLHSLKKFKIWAVVLGVIWVAFLVFLVWANHFANLYFSASVGILALFSVYAIVAYIRQVILISKLDYDSNILDTQKELAKLQLSTLQSTRILWLQMPFYTTWFWNAAWMQSLNFWLIAFPISLLFCLLALYLYTNITPENIHKNWVKRFMMIGPEYKNVVEAMGFMEEIEEFKKDLTPSVTA